MRPRPRRRPRPAPPPPPLPPPPVPLPMVNIAIDWDAFADAPSASTPPAPRPEPPPPPLPPAPPLPSLGPPLLPSTVTHWRRTTTRQRQRQGKPAKTAEEPRSPTKVRRSTGRRRFLPRVPRRVVLLVLLLLLLLLVPLSSRSETSTQKREEDEEEDEDEGAGGSPRAVLVSGVETAVHIHSTRTLPAAKLDTRTWRGLLRSDAATSVAVLSRAAAPAGGERGGSELRLSSPSSPRPLSLSSSLSSHAGDPPGLSLLQGPRTSSG